MLEAPLFLWFWATPGSSIFEALSTQHSALSTRARIEQNSLVIGSLCFTSLCLRPVSVSLRA